MTDFDTCTIVPGMQQVLAIANQKGGVGKTTTALNVADLVAAKRNVLLIDADPQAHATQCLSISAEKGTLYHALLRGAPIADVAIPWPGNERLWVLPSDHDLAAVETEMERKISRETQLRRVLSQIPDGTFDLIVIDCPPHLGLLTVNALAAADYVLIPVQTEQACLWSFAQFQTTIEDIKQVNPALKILGVLPTLYDGRLRHQQDVLAALRGMSGIACFDPIPRTTRFAEAFSRHLPIAHVDRAASTAYENLTETLFGS